LNFPNKLENQKWILANNSRSYKIVKLIMVKSGITKKYVFAFELKRVKNGANNLNTILKRVSHVKKIK